MTWALSVCSPDGSSASPRCQTTAATPRQGAALLAPAAVVEIGVAGGRGRGRERRLGDGVPTTKMRTQGAAGCGGVHLGSGGEPSCPSSRGNGGQDDQDAQVVVWGVHLAYVPKKERDNHSLYPRCAPARPPHPGAHLARCAPKMHTAFPPAHLGPAGALEPGATGRRWRLSR
jgi:hypothetical protein